MFNNFSDCYQGMDDQGRMILTPALDQSIKRHYASLGLPLREPGKARAFDSKPAEQPDDRYADLQALYDSVRGKAAGGFQHALNDEPSKIPDIEAAAEHTKQFGLRNIDTIARFRRARGLDASPLSEVQYYFDLENAFAEIRRKAREEQN